MKKADKLMLTLKGYEPVLITAVSRYMDASGRELHDTLEHLQVDMFREKASDRKFEHWEVADSMVASIIDDKRLGR